MPVVDGQAGARRFAILRHALGVLLLSLLAVASIADYALHWKRHNVWQEAGGVPIPRFMERRLAAVRDHLPARGVVGFLGDEPRPDYAHAWRVGAQYVLAPLVLDEGARHPLVLGNFFHTPDPSEVARRHGLHVRRDFGDGVVLFGKGSR